MAIFGSIATVRSQAPRTPVFAEAWKYLEQLLRPGSPVQARVAALEAGASQKHELGAGVFVIEQAYQTKARSDGFFEAHRKYIDIQVIVAGHEVMEVADLAKMKVRDPYDEKRDLVAFQDATGASLVRVGEGEAAVFFPVDVHMPSLRADASPVLVKKAVLKLPVEA